MGSYDYAEWCLLSSNWNLLFLEVPASELYALVNTVMDVNDSGIEYCDPSTGGLFNVVNGSGI